MPSGEETILIVDDEDVVRAVASAILNRHGYRTVGAASGEEAIAALERTQGDIDCVLLDLAMPGMSGREVLRVIQNNWPDLPVLMCSGYLSTDIPMDPTGADREIGKPYTSRQLLTEVGELLLRNRVQTDVT